MSMIEAYGYEESCNSYDESYSSKSKIVKKLITCKFIMIFYIEDSSHIECHFDNPYNPKYWPMYSIDQYKE